MAPATSRRHVVDANVLIDYANTEPWILERVVCCLGPVTVLLPTLGEVEQLDRRQCERLGLELVLPETDLLLAARAKKGPLSFQDHLCFLVAKDEGTICVTNEKALRRICKRHGVEVLWGLELMLELVRGHHLDPTKAIEVAEAIRSTNPFITEAIVRRFREKLGFAEIE